MQMSQPTLGDTGALRRFRAALAAVDEAPSEASIAALRQTAIPLMNQLRAAYTAADSPYGDDHAGVHRWLRYVIRQRDREAADLETIASWRSVATVDGGT